MPAYDDRRFSPPAPVAAVTLKHPDDVARAVEVPMLIDSGADVTLLPRSDVESLGIVATGERYQLMGFDGAISDAEVVRVDLGFQGRRFRGRFLLLDAEVGVLGRDVLNHLALLLDGPAARWEARGI